MADPNIVGAAPPSGMAVLVQRLPETWLFTSSSKATLIYDSNNDAIVFNTQRAMYVRPRAPAAGHTIDEWQTFRRLDGWLYDATTGPTTIGGTDKWCPNTQYGNNFEADFNGDLFFDNYGQPFEIIINTPVNWQGKITLQKEASRLGPWVDMQQWDGTTAIDLIYPQRPVILFGESAARRETGSPGPSRSRCHTPLNSVAGTAGTRPVLRRAVHTSQGGGDAGIAVADQVAPPAHHGVNMYAVVKLAPLPSSVPCQETSRRFRRTSLVAQA